VATFTHTTECYERQVWSIPTPCTAVEVQKAISAARTNAFVYNGGREPADDQILVELDDNEIRIVMETQLD
jgi:hypothetical protein